MILLIADVMPTNPIITAQKVEQYTPESIQLILGDDIYSKKLQSKRLTIYQSNSCKYIEGMSPDSSSTGIHLCYGAMSCMRQLRQAFSLTAYD